jgi:hypothetical protein
MSVAAQQAKSIRTVKEGMTLSARAVPVSGRCDFEGVPFGLAQTIRACGGYRPDLPDTG